jgi:hypothetical protein
VRVKNLSHLERGKRMKELYRIQLRHFVPYDSEEAFTDSQIVFNSREAMDKFVKEYERSDFEAIAQTEICQFNDRGILAKTKVIKKYL